MKKELSQSDYRRQTYIANWFADKVFPVILIIMAIGLIWFALCSSAWFDHKNYSSVPSGEITVLTENKTIFIPEGAYIIGDVHEYISDEDVTLDQELPENQPLKVETLVKTYGKVAVYFEETQKETVLLLLDN